MQEPEDSKKVLQRCTHYNEKKKRHCRQMISPWIPESFASDPNFQPLYCGNHSNLYTTLFKDRKRQKIIHSDGSKGTRIPCPIDPSHMIYEHNVKSHILKCPKAKVTRDEREKTYYVPNINGGGSGKCQYRDSQVKIDPMEFAIRVLCAFRNTFSAKDEEVGGHQNHDDADTDTITSLTLEEIYTAIPSENLFLEAENKVGLEDIIQSHRIKIGGHKHLEQIGSLLGHAQKTDLLSDTNTVLEMGAGRATTGFVISGVCCAQTQKNVRLVLVERGGSRAKADSALRRIHSQGTNTTTTTSNNEDGDGEKNGGTDKSEIDGSLMKESNDIHPPFFRPECVEFHRIKCDLAHVSLANVMSNIEETCHELPAKRDILVIAKHLCGAGTDLALKSLTPIRHRVCGCILATCCHGVCAWEHYVGRDYLTKVMCLDEKYKDVGFGEMEFNMMKKWATGTVIVDDKHGQSRTSEGQGADDEEEEDHPTSNKSQEQEQQLQQQQQDDDLHSPQDMSVTRVASSLGLQCGPQGLGRACQRLIDYGRCEYMRNEVFSSPHSKVSIVHYVEPHITPQNAMLLGIPSSGVSSSSSSSK